MSWFLLGVAGSASAHDLERTQVSLAFARDGRPGERSLPAWPRYETARRPTMLLGAASALASDPFGAERAAWDEIL